MDDDYLLGHQCGRTAYVRAGHGWIWSIAAHDEGKSRGQLGLARVPIRIPVQRYGVPDDHQRRLRCDHPAHRTRSASPDLPVPRFSSAVEQEIHGYIQAAADLRARFQAGVTARHPRPVRERGLPELIGLRWHRPATRQRLRGRGTSRQRRLRALNLPPRAQTARARKSHRFRIEHSERSVKMATLSRGNRFARIDADPVMVTANRPAASAPGLHPKGAGSPSEGQCR